mmetsp:Transcript_29079/g.55872  ORF Transcript_29079/g.55872 Transcript_29079/m.55872 type:complete len:207 (+) Transcript_29079:310-930(+)
MVHVCPLVANLQVLAMGGVEHAEPLAPLQVAQPRVGVPDVHVQLGLNACRPHEEPREGRAHALWQLVEVVFEVRIRAETPRQLWEVVQEVPHSEVGHGLALLLRRALVLGETVDVLPELHLLHLASVAASVNRHISFPVLFSEVVNGPLAVRFPVVQAPFQYQRQRPANVLFLELLWADFADVLLFYVEHIPFHTMHSTMFCHCCW